MTELVKWDRLATNEVKRDMLKRQFKLWKHNEDSYLRLIEWGVIVP